MAERKRRERIFGAAVLKLTYRLRQEEQSPGFLVVYEGVLRDLKLTDDEVERYLAEHREEVEKAIRNRVRALK